jgi:hypothetical protein
VHNTVAELFVPCAVAPGPKRRRGAAGQFLSVYGETAPSSDDMLSLPRASARRTFSSSKPVSTSSSFPIVPQLGHTTRPSPPERGILASAVLQWGHLIESNLMAVIMAVLACYRF